VSRRALGSLGGRSVFGHGVDYLWAVHVLSRFPVRSWIKQTSTVASGQSCHTSTPSGKDGTCPELVRDGLDWSVAGVNRVLNEAASPLVPCSWSVTDASEMAQDWFLSPFKIALTRPIWEMLLWRARKGVKTARDDAAMGYSLSDDVDPICVREVGRAKSL
jgi:hypothetical protein